MKILIWILRFIVFIALLGLAVKNSATVDLRFYFNQHLDAPLSLILLGAFAAGIAIGISAAMTTLLRQRREIGRLRAGKLGAKG